MTLSGGLLSCGPTMTLLAEVVAVSRALTDTSSRSQKVAILAELLERLNPTEIPAAVGFLTGTPTQGRVGIGYATVYGIAHAPQAEPSLTIHEVDGTVAEVQATTGPGSVVKRKQLLSELLGRATEEEADFVRRLFTGGLRQGALAGVMVGAIAKAARVRAELARRALMLSGALPQIAAVALTAGEDGLRAVRFELFNPILPMLASSAGSVLEAVESFDRSSVEWKLDGIRIQIHRRGDDVRIYTRKLNEITHALPGIVEACRTLPVAKEGWSRTPRRSTPPAAAARRG